MVGYSILDSLEQKVINMYLDFSLSCSVGKISKIYCAGWYRLLTSSTDYLEAGTDEQYMTWNVSELDQLPLIIWSQYFIYLMKKNQIFYALPQSHKIINRKNKLYPHLTNLQYGMERKDGSKQNKKGMGQLHFNTWLKI